MASKYESLKDLLQLSEKKVFLIVENIRSAYNVGAIFRTADGAGNVGIILAGYSPTPENPKVQKTALGAELSVPWTAVATISEVLSFGNTQNIEQIALELTKDAQNMFAWTPASYPLFLYIGNEVTGVSLEVMMEAKTFVMLPMAGKKASLNVAEAASIAMYELQRKISLV